MLHNYIPGFIANRPKLSATCGLMICIIFLYFFLLSSPFGFPVGRVVRIEEGWSVGQVAEELRRLKVIRSRAAFKLVSAATADGNVLAGDYFFSIRRNVFAVANKLSSGEYGLEPTKVTITEGSTVNEIAEAIAMKFPEFDSEEFLRLAAYKEGYLFPDTYQFLPNVSAESAIRTMEENFNKKIAELAEDVEKIGRPIEDVVTLASLLEKEASDTKTRQMISGILWKRLEIDMPLQVDAVFLYINGKSTYELSIADLRQNDSPYNTYKYKGLPPGPIGSPSLESIYAALNPIPSDYLYYLADRAGNTYYARTFDEHKANKNMYIY
jgi:UPF0755 protein